jgi:Mg-chelatase subunit ChlD
VRAPLREPFHGELDAEATVENLLGKPYPEAHDWVGVHREERRRQVVLMVDASLSMAGEKMALASVAAAVLALRSHRGDLSVVLFADEARLISRLTEEASPEEIVRRMLARPCGGATHIAAGLRRGHEELARCRDPRRSALLVTDGMFTAGPDPCSEAARFRDLHVLLIREHEHSRAGWVTPRRLVGEAIARAGHGHVVRVDGFSELPRSMVEVAGKLLR